MRMLIAALLASTVSYSSFEAEACAMFTIADGGQVLMGNNEDFIKPGHIWFAPGTKKRYGRVNVGFSDGFAQGSMNEAGLCFDAAALHKVPYTPDKNKKTPSNLIHKIMNECATVDEAIEYFHRFNCKHLAGAQFMFADKTGASAVVTWDPGNHISVTRRDGSYQLITNDRLEFSEYRCQRFVLADRELANAEHPTVSTARDVLRRIHQRGSGAFTSYSTVYDLKAGTIHIFNLANFDEALTLDLKTELAKGKSSFAMTDLFQQSPPLASIRDDSQVDYDTRVKLTESQLQRFAGDYLFEADGQQFPMAIAVVGDDVVLRREGQRDAVMYPESETLFRLVDGGQISFKLDADENAITLVLHRNGDHPAARVR